MSDINYTEISGEKLKDLVSAIEVMMVGQRESHILMACLSIILLIQCPNITGPQLAQGIQDTSNWISLYAQSLSPVQGSVN